VVKARVFHMISTTIHTAGRVLTRLSVVSGAGNLAGGPAGVSWGMHG